MKKINWKILLSVVLIGLSLSIYFINYSIFHKGEDTVYYFLIDLAFLPLSILLVTLIVDQLITRQERRNMFNKLNMVIGAFFKQYFTHAEFEEISKAFEMEGYGKFLPKE